MLASARDRREIASRVPIAAADPADDVAVQRRLVAALRAAASATLIETHISFVLLTGALAYKIKKAVNLRFLDFRTLAARRFYCEEELRLNRRLAPEIYLDVVAVTGTADAPRVAGEGPVLEYAVDARISAEALAVRRSRGSSRPGTSTRWRQGSRLPPFGRCNAPGRARRTAYDHVRLRTLPNFVQFSVLPTRGSAALAAWTSEHHAECAPHERAPPEVFIRECHGDLHLGKSPSSKTSARLRLHRVND